MKVFIVTLKRGIGKIVIVFVNKFLELNERSKIYQFFKRNSITLRLHDPEYLRNISLRKVAFTSPNSATFHKA